MGPIDILKGAVRDDRYFGIDELDEDWEEVEESDWTQDHKYQSADLIVKHVPTGRHFEITNTRSGSYHTDWYYSAPDIREVQQKTETITRTTWVAV